MVGVWGMNFKYMPELDYRWGYLVALLSMLLIGVLVVVYFRIKKWL
jgi:magnesium transporter